MIIDSHAEIIWNAYKKNLLVLKINVQKPIFQVICYPPCRFLLGQNYPTLDTILDRRVCSIWDEYISNKSTYHIRQLYEGKSKFDCYNVTSIKYRSGRSVIIFQDFLQQFLLVWDFFHKGNWKKDKR